MPNGFKCCDGIYVPSFYSINAGFFSQDRPVVSEITAGPDGAVVWYSSMTGVFYQPMDFSNYPFESIDLLAAVSRVRGG